MEGAAHLAAEPMRARYVLFVVAFVVVTAASSLIATVVLSRPSNRVLLELRQPETSANDARFSIYVLEGARDWATLGFPRRHRLLLTHAADPAPSYGHVLDYSFHASFEDEAAHIARSSAEWSEEGATFVESTGHRLFVPKAMYARGR